MCASDVGSGLAWHGVLEIQEPSHMLQKKAWMNASLKTNRSVEPSIEGSKNIASIQQVEKHQEIRDGVSVYRDIRFNNTDRLGNYLLCPPCFRRSCFDPSESCRCLLFPLSAATKLRYGKYHNLH